MKHYVDARQRCVISPIFFSPIEYGVGAFFVHEQLLGAYEQGVLSYLVFFLLVHEQGVISYQVLFPFSP